MGRPVPARAEYGLSFSREIERLFLRCRASVRTGIRERLESVALEAAKPSRRSKGPGHREPPLRFYVFEGYRVVYQLHEQTRRVVVLDVAAVVSP
jgi:mRNA-degrading endonuclease RelE of RelBE toxin-antitoxin system